MSRGGSVLLLVQRFLLWVGCLLDRGGDYVCFEVLLDGLEPEVVACGVLGDG